MPAFSLPHHHSPQTRHLKAQLDKTANFIAVSEVFKQLADSSRLRLFWLLCHCEECVVNLSAFMDMSSPALSHHLRQLKDSGLIVSRRVGKEVYYRAADSEQCVLLHQMIERAMAITCPEDDIHALADIPELPHLDASAADGVGRYTAEQLETIRRVHDFMTENLSARYTIDELARRFLINPSALKEVFKAVYGGSLASHIKEHRMELASDLLLNTGESVAAIAAEVGYENPSKFSAEFKKHFGLLPAAYRKAENPPDIPDVHDT